MRAFGITILIFLVAGTSLGAWELTAEQTFSNAYLSPDRSTSDTTFLGDDFFWGTDVHMKQMVNEGMYFQGGLDSSRVQMKKLYTLISFDNQVLEVGFGPFMGILNTEQRAFNPGLMARVGYILPGVLFLRTGFDSSFGQIRDPGDYYTNHIFLESGFYIPNAIITARSSFEEALIQKNGYLVRDNMSSYYLNTEVFVKNFPVRFNVDFEYQIAGKAYNPGVDLVLHSFWTGIKTVWEVNKDFQLFIGGRGTVFSFGQNDLDKSGNTSLNLYQFSAGFQWNFPTDSNPFQWVPPVNLSTEDLANTPPEEGTETTPPEEELDFESNP